MQKISEKNLYYKTVRLSKRQKIALILRCETRKETKPWI